MSPEFLTLAFGILLSLAVSYVPGLAGAYAALDGDRKRLVMLAGIIAVGVGAYALGCSGIVLAGVPAVECSQAGAIGVVQSVILAAIANQAAYALTPRSPR